ncbi:DUF1851 domain-containing protein [Massilia sp. PAMC28688]|uniref:DUF1851 domain-containing protein n=1 Tax=Massilia sp. PAMC28688 TaxID=2861283 RepID=UPI001C62EAEA|nr:DUF1851 domain-containing protein [Massilia sp. PAMC28688]QYF91777.1 DUF1851 domain-containing protein [Massilia sp. PAMC28688]
MFDNFNRAFIRDQVGAQGQPVASSAASNLHRGHAELKIFREQFGGASFCRGLYRAVAGADHANFVNRIRDAFPAYADRVYPLAFDWLNRVFCADFGRIIDSRPQVTIFGHLNDDVCETPVDVLRFHNNDLIVERDGLLQSELFEVWRRSRKLSQLPYAQCASFTVPLFLGGEYDAHNMDMTDAEMDWDITAQLLTQVRQMDDGDPVNAITIN